MKHANKFKKLSKINLIKIPLIYQKMLDLVTKRKNVRCSERKKKCGNDKHCIL